jgi:aminoglycoside phosphotransferase family enzyme
MLRGAFRWNKREPCTMETAISQPIELEEAVAFLRRPESYRGSPRPVDAIETHMAWVFLAGAHAYKLKKPVRYPFLDFSTLEARRLDCEAEVRLNRRLAPDVYLDVVSLARSSRGELSLAGGADTPLPPGSRRVEWLVKMRRLDRSRMLDQAIASGSAHPAEVRAAAVLLADFYASARPLPRDPDSYLAALRADVEDNRRELLGYQPHLPSDRVIRIGNALLLFFDRNRTLLGERAASGRILEGHGDLRPEHVFLGPPPAVIDCLEFNFAFRCLDAVDDLAFLALECERLGAPAVGDVFLRSYAERTGDAPGHGLVSFYKAHRAYLRAKIAIWHLSDGDLRAVSSHWVTRALSYLDLADSHLAGRETAGRAPPLSGPGRRR